MTQSGLLYSGPREIPSGSFRRARLPLTRAHLFVNSLVVSLWQSGSAQRIHIPVELVPLSCKDTETQLF